MKEEKKRAFTDFEQVRELCVFLRPYPGGQVMIQFPLDLVKRALEIFCLLIS